LQIPLRIDRRGDFTETLKLKPTGLAALESMKELEVEGKTNAATLELDLAQLKLPPGTHTFELQTQTKGKYRNDSNDAKQIEAAAKEASAAAKQTRERAEVLKADVKRTSEAQAAASKAADEAATLAKSVTETEKAAAEARAKAAFDLKADAEKAATAAATAAKETEEKKVALEKRSKELEEKTRPREMTITVYSSPITILVKDEPQK
jgi:colicin import membrane protein